MTDRRAFIIGALALAACGSEIEETAPPVETAVAAPPPPRPSPDGPRATGNWYAEGDSYMQGSMAASLRTYLGEPLLVGAAGGSDFLTIRDRIMGANATLRADPLIIWDGAMNSHVPGSIDLEMSLLRDIARFKGDRRNWLLVLPVPVAFDSQLPVPTEDIASLKAAVASEYGERHVYDPMPEIVFAAGESEMDASDISMGIVPRSALIDGIHLTDEAKRAVAARLAAPGGPMAAVRRL